MKDNDQICLTIEQIQAFIFFYQRIRWITHLN